MIISRGRAYIFVHIPKTGGTSLALALEERAMKDDILLGDTPKALRRRKRLKGQQAAGRLWKHATLADIDGLVAREELDDMMLFTMVRNPWDRLVSYYHWLREQSFSHPAVALSQSTEFRDFVLHPQTLAGLRDWPASRYLTDAGGRVREAQYLRLERFSEDAALLWTHLGFTLDLPHVNRSQRLRDWRRYYDDETAAAVSKNCAEDIAAFGYRFDPDRNLP